MANVSPTQEPAQGSNKKTIIIKIVLLVVVGLLVYFLFIRKGGKGGANKFKEAYKKKKGEWVGCDAAEYDKDYYSAINTGNNTIYVRKDSVTKRTSEDTKTDCLDAKKDLTVYTLVENN